MSFSVCVPVFDPTQKYSAHLFQLLNSINTQTLKPDEVVMTANHDLEYLNKLQEATNGNYELIFRRNESNGSAHNTNHAVSVCRGDLVKILHQDDFFIENNALSFAYNSLHKSEKNWRVSGFDHFVESSSIGVRPTEPKITWRLVNGVNRVGAPSVVTLKRSAFIPFDGELKYMFDCDWYLKMWHNWGKPLVSKNVEIRIRIHQGQSTHWAKKLLNQEVIATRHNHDKLHAFRNKCLCVT